MKLVISRKGFDSGTGGCPSPILPGGRMFSLPIPGGSQQRYEQIQTPVGPMSSLVEDLTRGKMRGNAIAHLDPDLSEGSLPRRAGWRPSLGQTGIAQSHLAAKGVGVGDLFLFFGWFRPVEEVGQGWRFIPGARDEHVMFGYMQVGEILQLGSRPSSREVLRERPWLEGHPHLVGERDANNTVYIASNRLVVDGLDTGLPGGGAFEHYDPCRVLTAPEGSKSLWKVPSFLVPSPDRAPLSYHGAPDRWSIGPDGSPRLQTVAKGQEFVIDTQGLDGVSEWIHSLLPGRPTPKLSRKPRMS